ncbi:hypothetical protein AVEN_148556-1 [Araneus ventricosus]|uniref:EGF-like domain-containing protein n=2 Tax=Araneus ventricosus TaxID=182803 RepID=A0A4Y2TAM5_ARAVE|nr:hypothetical protein AVEN_148556-1 [Araneus ventricosus]
MHGGRCIGHNSCLCPKEYRGSRCEYPLSNCEGHDRFASVGYKCMMTDKETVCNVSCSSTGMALQPPEPITYICSLDGTWHPDLKPICVSVCRTGVYMGRPEPGPPRSALACGILKDSPCNNFEYCGRSPSSQSPGHGPIPPEGGTYYHWWRGQEPHHYYTHSGSESMLTYPAATHIRVLAVPPSPWDQILDQIHQCVDCLSYIYLRIILSLITKPLQMDHFLSFIFYHRNKRGRVNPRSFNPQPKYLRQRIGAQRQDFTIPEYNSAIERVVLDPDSPRVVNE